MAGVRPSSDREMKAQVALRSLSTLHRELADNIDTIFRWSRGRIPQQCLNAVCRDPRYSQVSRVRVEACLIGLWAIQEFWSNGQRDTAWDNSLKLRRRRVAPYQKELRSLDVAFSKFAPAKDRWLTSAGRDRMQALLIVGLMSGLTDKRIEIGFLRPLYPMIVPFILADKYGEIMSPQLASEEWKEFVERKSTDDDIYQNIRVRFYELKKATGSPAAVFALGRKLLNQVKATVQTFR